MSVSHRGVESLPWSGTGTSYSVQESSSPNGYSADPANTNPQMVTVSRNAKCSDANIASEAAPASFNDMPLTNISANATSVLPGATNSTITRVDSTGKVVADSGYCQRPSEREKHRRPDPRHLHLHDHHRAMTE